MHVWLELYFLTNAVYELYEVVVEKGIFGVFTFRISIASKHFSPNLSFLFNQKGSCEACFWMGGSEDVCSFLGI
jgi:hypothetical protein